MTRRLRRTATILIVVGAVLAGCVPGNGGGGGDKNDKTPSPVETPGVVEGVSWEEAKAQAQAMELEIAGLVPAEVVVGVEQKPTGVLLSCSETEWRWKGATTVTVVAGTEIEPIVRAIEADYAGSRFDLRTRLNIDGQYEVQLMSPQTAENYIVAEGFEPGQLRISSGSVCFTLPEDVWPGGDF